MKRWIIIFVTAGICSLLAWFFGRMSAPKPEFVTDTITDTIVNWKYDTIYRYDTKVVKLPIHDTTTVTDSLLLVDSVMVDVPIYKYHYDTTLSDTHGSTRLTATMSGYDVNIDTLEVTTTITPIIIKETLPWYKRFRPSVGIGIGTNYKGEATAGLYVGVGYLF